MKDDGVGMEQKSGRTGLGSKIIAQLDATIELDSAPDAGTKVTLRLPMQAKETRYEDDLDSSARASAQPGKAVMGQSLA
jgi:hypothetical protein